MAGNDNFLPLAPASPAASSEAASFRLKVVPTQAKPAATPAFTPTALPHSHAPGSRGPAQPTVTLKRDGDRITSIHVHCTCGQVIELNCAY